MRLLDRKPGKYSQIKSDTLVTKEKFNELKKELEHLKNNVRPPVIAEVSRLAELGDFSENAGYQFAKGKLRGINNAILKIEYQIKQAVIIDPATQKDIIEIGHKVTIENGEKQITYQILGSMETNPQKGIISHNSPIGSALLGHKIGDKIKIKLTNKEVEYKIVKIEN